MPRLGIPRWLCLLVALAVPGGAASAQTAAQTFNIGVSAINLVAFTGVPALTVSAAVSGSQPTAVTNNVGRWAVTTNQSNAKITARIPTNMPAGLVLSGNLAAPAGATSAGFQPLSIISVDLVTTITQVAQGGMIVTYRLAATAAAGVIPAATRIVTYTITGGT